MSLQAYTHKVPLPPAFPARFHEAIGFANTNRWKNRISTRNLTLQSALLLQQMTIRLLFADILPVFLLPPPRVHDFTICSIDAVRLAPDDISRPSPMLTAVVSDSVGLAKTTLRKTIR